MKKDIKEIIILVIIALCLLGVIIYINTDHSENKKVSSTNKNKYDNLIVSENNSNTNNSNSDSDSTNTSTDNNIDSNTVVKTDEDLVEYIEDVELRVNDIVEKEEVSKSEENVLRNTFITLTDFIFYDGEIKGKKFSDLTSACKEKVIDIYTKIDSKIESKYPNYKENIKETSKKVYKGAIEKAKQVKENIQEKYKNYVGEDNYNDTVEEYERDKQNMKDVYNIYEPYIETAKEKTKSGAKKVKEAVSNWYKNYKENGD